MLLLLVSAVHLGRRFEARQGIIKHLSPWKKEWQQGQFIPPRFVLAFNELLQALSTRSLAALNPLRCTNC